MSDFLRRIEENVRTDEKGKLIIESEGEVITVNHRSGVFTIVHKEKK